MEDLGNSAESPTENVGWGREPWRITLSPSPSGPRVLVIKEDAESFSYQIPS